MALTPEGVRTLRGRGAQVVVQSGAGRGAYFEDSAYEEAGAILEPEAAEVYKQADVLLRVIGPQRGVTPESEEVAHLRGGQVLIAFLYPLNNLPVVRLLAERGVTAFAMDLMPRISRAQSMDALSSMSSIAGYKAVLLAAGALPKFFPMMMTAAGSIAPARVFVVGAGVAGLQAIATARRLGAVVEAFDVRPAVKEQVESLGAKFIDLGLSPEEAEDASGYAKEVSTDTHIRELQVIAERLKRTDVLITTALVPGKPAPVLVTADMVRLMPPGSVIVDLAAPNGGNCELTVPGQTVEKYGVTIMGPLNLPSGTAVHASQMYSRNITTFLLHLIKDGQLALDFEDEVVWTPLVTYQGKIMHEPTRLALERGGG